MNSLFYQARRTFSSLTSPEFARLASQTYPLHPSIKLRPGAQNLMEMVCRFPKKGKGMKAYRKSWPEDCYWLLMHCKVTQNHTHRLYGIQYWKGQL